MIIKCSFSVPLEGIRDYAREVSELCSLPEYITKRGPYIKEGPGAFSKIIILYEFEKSKIVEVWETISKQLDTFRSIPGFALSAHILGKGREVKRGPMDLEGQGTAKLRSRYSQGLE
jgi:hypothetical protein